MSKITPEIVAAARARYEQGYNVHEVGLKLGIHPSTLRDHLLKAGVQMRKRGKKETRRQPQDLQRLAMPGTFAVLARQRQEHLAQVPKEETPPCLRGCGRSAVAGLLKGRAVHVEGILTYEPTPDQGLCAECAGAGQ